ncbi:MAG: hypothetical protein AAF290_05865 [Pseudomonadota bacterium]
MAKLSHLAKVAWTGFNDMAPALQRAFNDSPNDDQLSQVFGERPRTTILALSAASILGGFLFQTFTPPFSGKDFIDWPAVAVSSVFAFLFRRYLFDGKTAKPDDFPWLAASVIPAIVVLVVIGLVTNVINQTVEPIEDGPFWISIGYVAELLARSCSVAAALTIALAALSFSRDWVAALIELGVNLVIFLAVLWFMAFMMFEVEIMDRIISAIMDGVFGIQFPGWVGDFIDQMTYAFLLLSFYFSIVGATWIVCREQFPTLLESGEVNVLKSVKQLIDPPSQKQLKKDAEKAEKKAAKAAAKKAKQEKRSGKSS